MMLNQSDEPPDGIRLPQDVTMTNVDEIRRCILDAPQGARAVIDARAVEKIDLVGMQLIIAALGVGDQAARLSAFSPTVAQAFARAGVPLPSTY